MLYYSVYTLVAHYGNTNIICAASFYVVLHHKSLSTKSILLNEIRYCIVMEGVKCILIVIENICIVVKIPMAIAYLPSPYFIVNAMYIYTFICWLNDDDDSAKVLNSR